MRLIILLLSLVSTVLSAQITDDFTDGDFTNNPVWTGTTASFIINAASELQLNAPAAGNAVLAVQGTLEDSLRWRFNLRMPFAPSATNKVRIYLQSNQADLLTGNGYFLEIGENGTADALRLFRQDGGAATLIASGLAGTLANTVDARVFVKRSSTGVWTAEMSTSGGAPVAQFQAADATYTGGSGLFFGFYCVFTASRVDQFFFDNVLIEEDLPDAQPPVLLSAQALSANAVELVFNEALDPLSSQNATLYNISGIGAPTAAVLQPDAVTVQLQLANALSSGQNYTVTATQIQDLLGNALPTQEQSFFFFQPDQAELYDVLVNEFMSDPSPSAGLPEVEWVELYNRSAKFINANSLTLRDATSAPIPLSDYVMAPGTYTVLSTVSGAAALAPFAADTVLAIAMPSLNNDAENIILERKNDGARVDRIAFTLAWHTDSLKRDGGWTLERINPNLVCKGADNWQSSPALTGGTPGAANASLDNSPDITAPQLLEAFTNGPQELLLQFSEALDAASAENTAAYTFTPGIGVGEASIDPDNLSQVTLTLSSPLQTGQFYQLSVSNSVEDCSGNGVAGASVNVVLPDVPALFDVVVTEIMSDPGPNVGLPEFEWIELYNRSNKLINLSSMTLRDETADAVQLPNYLLAPGQYVTLTSPAGVAGLTGFAENLLATDLPSLNNTADLIILERVADLARIERVSYSISWHAEIDKRDGGWSLERINPELPCLGRENWQSCLSLPGGTPGRQNTSYAVTPDQTQPLLLNAFPTDAQTLELRFSEGMDGATLANPSAFNISPGIGVGDATADDIDLTLATLFLDAPLQAGQLYQLQLANSVQDCSGNSVSNSTVTIGLPTKPDPLDVVVNEIMFNPASGGSRYVEMYNRSNKTFNLKEFYLANFFDGTDVKPIDLQRLFLPEQYVVVCANADDITSRFSGIVPENVVEMDYPGMDDKVGTATLIWTGVGQSVTLDSFAYTEDYHNAVYNVSEREGVALERIRVDGPTNVAYNWTSASRLVTGAPGTPTLPNSQAELPLVPGQDDRIRLLTKRLSPDGDGFEDFLEIAYELPSTGYSGEAIIYESGGQAIKHLQRQVLLGSSGALRWDGDTDEGVLARPGIYILYFELFDEQGNTEQIKKTFALVQQFD